MGRITITIDQSYQVVSVLVTNTVWEEIDFEGAKLQDLVIRNPKEAGRQFTAFLKNGGKMIIGEPKVIPIDRTAPFDLVRLLGQGWAIEEQDERCLALPQVNLANIRLEHMLKKGENQITGEEKLKRLKKAGHIRLDAMIFQALWENQALIPEAWKQKINGNTAYIFFDGTILRDPDGRRDVLYLYWSDGRWRWSGHWLGSSWDVDNPSAVLASI